MRQLRYYSMPVPSLGQGGRKWLMATLEELERAFHADPALAGLLATLDRAAAVTAAAGLTIADLLADLPAIREQVARATYGDAYMDRLHRTYEALRAAGMLVVTDDAGPQPYRNEEGMHG